MHDNSVTNNTVINGKVALPVASVISQSEYLTVRDGTRLAVSFWLNDNDDEAPHNKRPAIVTTTRYWRANAFKDDRQEYQYFYDAAAYYSARGYVFVAVDVRGTGASFGEREAEMSPAEVDDIGDIIHWVSQQPWCDGRAATEGVSYTASTALYGLVTASPALKLCVCRAPDFDGYRHLLAPGGIVNHWFIDAWGATTEALDGNDAKALMEHGYIPPPSSGAQNLSGVRPVDVDRDGALLNQALAEHKANFNLQGQEHTLEFFDNILYDKHRTLFDAGYQQQMEQSGIPVVIRCGWHDGGTALGALAMFATFDAPIRVILDPWNHTGNSKADPFTTGDGTTAEERTMEDLYASTAKILDAHFKDNSHHVSTPSKNRVVEYYTLGENRWKSTPEWPLPQTTMQRWYAADDHQLSLDAPTSNVGCDLYQVDPTTSTGFDNRWHAQARLKPILFPDRQEEDKKLLVYDTPPLDTDVEITGHPSVHLQLRSDATDGQFFAYLETIDPDGRVRLLTEGQLRGIHRKVCTEAPPYSMFGPYHSLAKKDAQPLVPGEVTEIAFDCFPISALLKKGQRIRLAIAGADQAVFAAIPGFERPEISIERNSLYASYIDLPIIDRKQGQSNEDSV